MSYPLSRTSSPPCASTACAAPHRWELHRRPPMSPPGAFATQHRRPPAAHPAARRPPAPNPRHLVPHRCHMNRLLAAAARSLTPPLLVVEATSLSYPPSPRAPRRSPRGIVSSPRAPDCVLLRVDSLTPTRKEAMVRMGRRRARMIKMWIEVGRGVHVVLHPGCCRHLPLPGPHLHL